jgi:hypothetical protein
MQPSNRIPWSRFPADLLSVLLLPGTAIFYAVASYLPRFWRGTVFAALDVLFMVAAFHLVRSSRRVELWAMAAVYLLMAIGIFYIAYVEAVLFA